MTREEEGNSTSSTLVSQLTRRELEIWQLIAEGNSNKTIANFLVVEVSTVKWHVGQLYKKLGVHTRMQAIQLARVTPNLYEPDFDAKLRGIQDAAEQRLTEVEQRHSLEKEQSFSHNRRLRWSLLGAFILVLLFAAIGISVSQQSAIQRTISTSRELAAAANDQADRDPQLAILLALEAVNRPRDADLEVPREAIEALHLAIQSARLNSVITSGEKQIASATYGADGDHLIVSFSDNTLGMWDQERERFIASFEGHDAFITDMIPASDSSIFVTTSRDKTIRVWDPKNERELLRFTEPEQIFDGTLHPDNRLLATVGNSADITLWDIKRGQKVRALEGHTDFIPTVEFHPEGIFLASGSLDHTIRIWDPETGEELQILDAHDTWITRLAFNADGSRLASGGLDGSIIIWDTTNWQQQAFLEAYAGAVIYLSFSPEGEILASAGSGHIIKLWDMDDGDQPSILSRQATDVSGLSFHPHEPFLAVSSIDGIVQLISLTPGVEVVSHAVNKGGGLVTYYPTGSQLAFVKDGSSIHILGEESRYLLPDAGQITSLAISADGEEIASATDNGAVILWDQGGNLLFHGQPFSLQGNQVVFSPDGKVIAAAGEDQSVILLAAESGELQTRWILESPARSLAYSPDGTQLAIGMESGLVKIYDLDTSKLVIEFVAHSAGINKLVYHPEQEVIATAGQEGAIKVWDVSTDASLRRQFSTVDPVTDLAFSPEGLTLAGIEFAGSIYLWNIDYGDESLILPIDQSYIGSASNISFSPDGKRLAVGGSSAVIVLSLDLDELMDLAEQRLRRGFTEDECAFFLPGGDCSAEATPLAGEVNTTLSGPICFITSEGGLTDEINRGINRTLMDFAYAGNYQLQVFETKGFENLTKYLDEAISANCKTTITLYNELGGLAQTYAVSHPDIQFLLLDYEGGIEHQNTWVQLYAPEHGAFLAGYLAAAITESGIVGTFGGIPYSAVTRFMSGFESGVRYYNLTNGTSVDVIGWDHDTGEGLFIGDFCCMDEGRAMAERLVAEGVDIILPVAGPYVGRGVLDAADASSLMVIGVDFDWAKHWGSDKDAILGSVIKRYDQSVEIMLQAVASGHFEGGTYTGTLSSGEIEFGGLHTDIPDSILRELEQVKQALLDGSLTVGLD